MSLLFEKPLAPWLRLRSPPVLESWDSAAHPSQIRLQAYLDEIEDLLGTRSLVEDQPLVVELDVGLPPTAPLTSGGHDLDNYLMPIARRLGAGRLLAAFATKSHRPVSRIRLGLARRTISAPEPQLVVRTTSSTQTTAWKHEIRDACMSIHDQPADDDTALGVRLEFGVSTRRNCSTLWKPAIDALGPVLGAADAQRPFAPRDDRIVDLRLHCRRDDGLGNDVELSGWWWTAA